MKKQFINSLSSGEAVDDLFVLSEKTLGQKKDGNPYLNATLCDRTGSIKAVAWDNVSQISGNVSNGDFVKIRGLVSEYKGILQLVIREMTAHDPETVDAADFLPVSRRNPDTMLERLQKLIDSVQCPHLKQLLESFFNDTEFVRKFTSAPAGKKMHHAYIGGLLEHSLSVSILADKVASHYSGIDRDLLLAGALLHDVGKIREFSYRTAIDYSDEGRLLSHIIVGLEMVDEKLNAIHGFPEEKALLLKHMIISHHGTREFGSPEPPKTIEAVLLNYVDEIDSKVNAIREFMDKENTGETWTSFHRLLGRHFYMGNHQETSGR
ncbi:MAG: HD domain-containing protein [Desulfobacterales bacterium]|nr:HD domain-containing protein [Desulfobacterales bacterium]MDD4071032.1 HD domain-containing protein [Desulfobacterales bacterium]MDD4392428.1 HD domain-containing protein [Desulfobacterales bacterium]